MEPKREHEVAATLWDAAFRAGYEAGRADERERVIRQARRAVEISDALLDLADQDAHRRAWSEGHRPDPEDPHGSPYAMAVEGSRNLQAARANHHWTRIFAEALGLGPAGEGLDRARMLGWAGREASEG